MDHAAAKSRCVRNKGYNSGGQGAKKSTIDKFILPDPSEGGRVGLGDSSGGDSGGRTGVRAVEILEKIISNHDGFDLGFPR